MLLKVYLKRHLIDKDKLQKTLNFFYFKYKRGREKKGVKRKMGIFRFVSRPKCNFVNTMNLPSN